MAVETRQLINVFFFAILCWYLGHPWIGATVFCWAFQLQEELVDEFLLIIFSNPMLMIRIIFIVLLGWDHNLRFLVDQEFFDIKIKLEFWRIIKRVGVFVSLNVFRTKHIVSRILHIRGIRVRQCGLKNGGIKLNIEEVWIGGRLVLRSLKIWKMILILNDLLVPSVMIYKFCIIALI